MISFPSLTQDILKFIRRNRSQSKMDEELSLGSGQYQRWELGKVEIKWDDFVIICKKANLPLSKALSESLLYKGKPFYFQEIIRASCGGISQSLLGKQLNVSRYTANRWLMGRAVPSVAQILQVIHIGSTRLPVFLHVLLEGHTPPSIAGYLKNTKGCLKALEAMPWISGILCALDLTEYRRLPKHDEEWIARTVRLPASVVQNTLQELEKLNLIVKKGLHFEVQFQEVNPAVMREKAKLLLIYWMNRNIAAIETSYPSPERKSLSSYHVFSVDKQSASAIKELYVNFTRQMAIILNEGQKKPEEIYSFTLSMVNFEELPS